MGLFDSFRLSRTAGEKTRLALTSADLAGLMAGTETESGAYVTASNALNNTAVLRCVSLISETIGMLPMGMIERSDEKRAVDGHPVHTLLKHKPNSYQSAYKFRSHMQLKALQHGNAYARIVRSLGRPVALLPLDPSLVTPELVNFELIYRYQTKAGIVDIKPEDMLHIADLSEDGIVGLSRVQKAKDAIGIALQAEKAAARLFKNGVMAGGALQTDKTLTDKQFANIEKSLLEKYTGAANSQKWMLLEDGLKAEKWANTAQDSQHIENRNHQIEEIGRVMGVPRPLMMMDDTSWGSGVEQLGIFFVQYGLQHWFTAWEQACEFALLTDAERDQYHIKINEKALYRGTLKDQADFFAKALGSGGHTPWMVANEVRQTTDMPRSTDPLADSLNPTTKATNEPQKTA